MPFLKKKHITFVHNFCLSILNALCRNMNDNFPSITWYYCIWSNNTTITQIIYKKKDRWVSYYSLFKVYKVNKTWQLLSTCLISNHKLHVKRNYQPYASRLRGHDIPQNKDLFWHHSSSSKRPLKCKNLLTKMMNIKTSLVKPFKCIQLHFKIHHDGLGTAATFH